MVVTRRISALVSVLVVAILLSGCVASPAGSSTTSGASTPAAESTPAQVVESGAATAETQTAPAAAPATPASAPKTSAYAPKLTKALVTYVVDGDTIHVRMPSGGEEKIRIIGIDTPEDTKQVDPFGPQATAYARAQLSGRTVWLEPDAEPRDRYGRLLAYVWLAQPTSFDSAGLASDSQVRANMYDAKVALAGLAMQMTIPPNVKYAERFRTYVKEARDAKRGLWAGGAVSSAPAPSKGGYIANSRSMKFHRADCQWAAKISVGNRVEYATRTAALDAGYEPCRVCRP